MLQVDGGVLVIILTTTFLWSDNLPLKDKKRKYFCNLKLWRKVDVGPPSADSGENGSRLAGQACTFDAGKDPLQGYFSGADAVRMSESLVQVLCAFCVASTAHLWSTASLYVPQWTSHSLKMTFCITFLLVNHCSRPKLSAFNVEEVSILVYSVEQDPSKGGGN